MRPTHRLLQLLADNRQAPSRAFAVRPVRAAAEGAADEAEILLYDVIVDSEAEAEWWGGVAPEPFVRALKEIDAAVIHLRINSPGGSVFAARAMESALREHPARVVVHIDALAASAASFLAMAGDEIVIAKGAMLMIHKAWTIGFGNADDLKATAALLDKIDGTLVETYVDRSGAAADDVRAWMASETWFTAQEAVEAGFADAIAEAPAPAEPAAAAAWNLAAYAHAPQRVQTPGPTPAEARDSAARQLGAPLAEVFVTADHRTRQAQRLRAAAALPIE